MMTENICTVLKTELHIVEEKLKGIESKTDDDYSHLKEHLLNRRKLLTKALENYEDVESWFTE